MKKNVLNWMLMVALGMGLGLSISACSDDDDDNSDNVPEGKRVITAEMVAQQGVVASVLSALTGVESDDSVGIDFEIQRFTPKIGLVRDEANPFDRSVLVNDETEASLKFRNLASNEDFVQETADGYVIDLTNLDYRMDGRKQKLGKLTYHRGTDGRCEAYVDVEIPCIPTLNKITYLTKDQWGSNGWDEYGRWESPCYIGQVWFNSSQGLYYVCVVQSKSDTDGWLINVQPGRGNMSHFIQSNEGNKGAWAPDHPVSKEAIEGFVKLCIDANYYDMKQAIRKKYPNKVFPAVPVRHGKGQACNWNDYGYLHTTDGDDGFGTSQKFYGHWVGDLGSDNPKDYNTPGDGPEVLIIRNAWTGSWAWSPPRNWRHQEVYCMAPRAHYSSSRYWYTKSYVYHFFEDSDYCDWMNKKYPYTANGYSFRGSVPAGFGSKPVFDPADEGF